MSSLKELEAQLERRRLQQASAKVALDSKLNQSNAMAPQHAQELLDQLSFDHRPKALRSSTNMTAPASECARGMHVETRGNITSQQAETPPVGPQQPIRCAQPQECTQLSPTSAARAAAQRKLQERAEIEELTADLSPTSGARVAAQRRRQSRQATWIKVPKATIQALIDLSPTDRTPGAERDDEGHLHIASHTSLGGVLQVERLLGESRLQTSHEPSSCLR